MLNQMINTSFELDYGPNLEEEIVQLVDEVGRFPQIAAQYPPRWLAIKLLERDEALQQQLLHMEGGPALLTTAQLSCARLEAVYGEDVDVFIADRRYGWIHELVEEAAQRPSSDRLTLSDRVDRIVTHRIWGIPIFLMMMWVVFKITADVSAPLLDWVDGVIGGPLTHWLLALLTAVGLNGAWVQSLLVDGVVAGVGGVLVFVPVLMSLYLSLALLEDSGYMARGAFVMDRFMNRIGLHGQSFLPLVVGFGCSVPAIYATRTLENRKDRLLTGLLVPFMSCGARLPVYILFAAIFFPQQAGVVIFGLYMLGILVAVLLGITLRLTFFQTKEEGAFIMELPPYRMPSWRTIWQQTWQRTSDFIRNAWTLILAASVVIWLLTAVPVRGEGQFADTPMADSAFATLAEGISPIFAPLGFDNWQNSGALITGLVAKEVVISTMAQTYGLAEDEETAVAPSLTEDLHFIGSSLFDAVVDTAKSLPLIVGVNLFGEEEEGEPTALMAAIQTGFDEASGGHGHLAALAYLAFILLYTPCFVTLAAFRHELGARWMGVSVVGQFAIAWVVALLIFQIGRLLGLG